MSKKFWLKLLVFALTVSMVLSFAACDRGNDGTGTTEKPTEVTTQSPSKETTESKQNEMTEPKGDTETTEPKGDTDATEPVGDTDATEPDDTDETDSDAPVGPEIWKDPPPKSPEMIPAMIATTRSNTTVRIKVTRRTSTSFLGERFIIATNSLHSLILYATTKRIAAIVGIGIRAA